MNVREGMRRLGLVVGVLGAGVGAAVAYMQLQPLLTQRAQYKSFQALVSSPTVKKEIELLKVSVKHPPPPPAGLPPDAVPVQHPDFAALAALCGEVGGWKVNKGGIRAIYFWASTDEKQLDSRVAGNLSTADISDIETDDGQKLHRTDPPGFWVYLLIPALPVLGFLVPWGTIKTLTWIGTGFFQQTGE